ncbi:formate dehydrogenase accessory sulfurtransferase FdhD [Candidatus Corynebacterium faecigallinarum]|uniref:formate dehydrogenase accessory sulfurtransferase FdhD n=1 Tax=Candidatus Corynebacterium faecigallinarum TaxID=2838528 RepID=UPI003FD0D8EA
MGRLIDKARVTKVRVSGDSGGARGATVEVDTRADRLAVEEPLQIRVDGTDLSTTMRTPGHDIELVHGLLHAEGVISHRSDVSTARYCAGAVGPNNENTYNTLDVSLTPPDLPVSPGSPDITPPPSALRALPVRAVTTNSACGVCGTRSIDDLLKQKRYTLTPVRPTPTSIIAMPQALREAQEAFRKTGGIHAAGAFTADGRPLIVREDVGRHNAADKVIGALMLDDRLPGDVDASDPDRAVYLVMSSRASFELVQKAVLAGFSGLVAVSAATSLAVDMARESGLLLTGFTRDDRFNLYSGDLAS